jgi:hypothetical protein
MLSSSWTGGGFAVLWFVSCGACSSGESKSDLLSVEELCDGSNAVRFAYQQAEGQGQLSEGTGLLFENGSSFMLVNGSCEFWVGVGVSSFEDYHMGILDHTQARGLIEATRLGEWRGVNDLIFDGTAFDAGTMRFWDGESWVALSAYETPGDAPDVVRALWSFRSNSLLSFWESGKPVDGPVRYRVFERDGIAVPTATWPLETPIDLVTEDALALAINDFGKGRLVGDEAELAKLRELRRSYATERPYGFPQTYGYLPIGDGSLSKPSHWLFVRDTTPFEGDDGLIAWPWTQHAE